MANYLPFDSILDGENQPDRALKAADWAWYFSTFIGNGVFPKPADGLQVLADEGMNIVVKAGFGFINGYAFRNTGDHVITVGMADGSQGRIDRVVLRWDLVNRIMQLDIKQGTVSSDPVAPALTRTADIYELALADISVTKGLTTITQSHITDQRTNVDLCGIVEGTVSQIDWEQLTLQLNTFMSEYTQRISDDYAAYTDDIETYEANFKAGVEAWEANEQELFTAWFEAIRGQLDEDAAGHLQNQIDYLKSQVGIPDAYDPERIYEKGERCIVNNVLYRCTQETIGGGFDLNYWRQTTVLKEIDESVNDAKENFYQEIAKGTLGIDSGLFITASGDHLKVTDTEDTLSVHQTVKFNFS